MFYSRKKIIENITSFDTTSKHISYNQNKQLFVDDHIIEKNTDCLGVFLSPNLYAYSNYSDFKTRVIDLNLKHTLYVGNENIQNQIIFDKFLSYYYDESFNSFIALFDADFSHKTLLPLKNVIFNLTYKNFGFQNFEGKHIRAYKLPITNTLWHFDLSQFGEWDSPAHGTRNYEVKDFLGVYDNQLLVQLSNFKLISIDVNTGKLGNVSDLWV